MARGGEIQATGPRRFRGRPLWKRRLVFGEQATKPAEGGGWMRWCEGAFGWFYYTREARGVPEPLLSRFCDDDDENDDGVSELRECGACQAGL